MKGKLVHWVPRVVFLTVVIAQLCFLVRGYDDPHKHFAFQPFNEADRWRYDIYRIERSGRRYSVTKPWAGYRWASLVLAPGLDRPGRWSPASSGIGANLAFLNEALAWVANHTPKDRRTIRFEAEVRYTHNGRGPFDVTLTETRKRRGAPGHEGTQHER